MNADQIASVLGPVLEQFTLDLDAVEVKPAGKRTVVRVVVDGDGPDGGGPSLDDIAEATRAVSATLDSSDVTGKGPYTLEVTSRGVTRPLTLPRHWRRNLDRLVKVSLTSGATTSR
jgi:ribosome maturation factor RimP